MENQKIQQLIRLASIADNNGDYKIADKIFEKLAAAPPPRYRSFEKFMTWAISKAGTLDKLLHRIEDLEKLKEAFDIKKSEYEYKTQMDIQKEFDILLRAKENLPKLKAELVALKAKREMLEGSPNRRDIDDADLKIIRKNEAIEIAQKNIDDLNPIYGHMRTAPISYIEIEEELKKINQELAKVQPALKELASTDPRRIAIIAMQKHFERANMLALEEAQSTLGPIFRDEGVTIVDKTNPIKVKGLEIGKESTQTRETIKKIFDWKQALVRPYALTYRALSKQWDEFKLQKRLLQDVPEKAIGLDRQKFTPETPKNKSKNKPSDKKNTDDTIIDEPTLEPQIEVKIQSSMTPFLRDTLGDMIELYDYKFIMAFREEVNELVAEYAQGSARSGGPKFDINNPEHFKLAASRAFDRLQAQDPTGNLFIGLFDSMKTFVKEESIKAKNRIGQNTTDKLITDNIIKNNPNILRDTGLSADNLLRMVSKKSAFSLEEFLEFQPGSVKKIQPAGMQLFKGLLLSGVKGVAVAAVIGALLYPFRNTFIVKKGLDVVTNKEGREKDKATKDRDDEARRLEIELQKALKKRGHNQ